MSETNLFVDWKAWAKTLSKDSQQFFYCECVKGKQEILADPSLDPNHFLLKQMNEALEFYAEQLGSDTPRNVRVVPWVLEGRIGKNVLFDNPVNSDKEGETHS